MAPTGQPESTGGTGRGKGEGMEHQDSHRSGNGGEGTKPQVGPCPVSLRIYDLVVDLVGVQLVIYLLAFVLGGFLRVLHHGGAASFGALRALTFLVFLAGAFAYYFVFEYRLGKTPGKFLTRTRVVSSEGGKPSRRAILVRTAVRFIPFEWVSFVQKNPVGWHDSLSGTMVVRDRAPAAAAGAGDRGQRRTSETKAQERP